MSGLLRMFSNTQSAGLFCGSQFSMTVQRRCVAWSERAGCRTGEGGEADAGCARDENRGAGFQVENEMELNDS